MNEIKSLQNPRFKLATKLHNSRGRSQQKRFIVFGVRECRLAIEASKENRIVVQEVFVCKAILGEDDYQHVSENVESEKLFEVPQELCKKLEFGDRQVGLVVVAERPDTGLDALELDCSQRGSNLVMVLESVEKPGNIDAILRSCDGAGVDTLILANPLADFFNHNCIRASLGAVFTKQLAVGTTKDVQEFLVKQNFNCFAAMPDAKVSYRDAKFAQPNIAIIVGNEANGLSSNWDQQRWNPISIPMAGRVDSLNVSVSAALLAYEAAARRKHN